MLDRCDFRTCGECSCEPSQCRVQNINIDEDHTLGTLLAIDRAGWAVRYCASVAIAAALISSSFVFFAVPDGKRQALRNQEQVSWR